MSLLVATGLSKRFGAKSAVEQVDLTLRAGELLAVCGENGAGKSTLLRMIAGLLPLDEGQIELDGQVRRFDSPRAARAAGVAMVEQHLALALELDAVKNCALLGGAWLRLPRAAIADRLRRCAAELGLQVPLEVPTAQLDVGQRQKVELLRALAGGVDAAPHILVLDEPTAVLLPHEASALYALLRRLVERGTCVVVVTHRLGEIAEHADHVVVLTRGKKVYDAPMDREARDPLAPITQVVLGGRVPDHAPPAPPPAEAPIAFELRGVHAGALREVSLQLRRGEVLGVAGVQGNGQRELFELACGVRAPERGDVRGHTRAFVVPDRHEEGLVLDASVADNLLLGDHGRGRWRWHPAELLRAAQARLRGVQVAGAEPLDRVPARALSGGNQQKLLIARALCRAAESDAAFLVLAEPTRGVDAGAQAEIHALLREQARAGLGLLVLSSELEELRALCHRLVVLESGHLLGPFPRDVDDDTLARAMLGVKEKSVGASGDEEPAS